MRLVTWNINGIRSLKGDWKQTLDSLNADIICLQETKVTRDNLEEKLALVEGYSSFFAFSRRKMGYSGVATFCSADFTPVKAEEGLSGTLPSAVPFPGAVGFYDGIQEEFSAEDLKMLDAEGRCVITCHKVLDERGQVKELALFNVYCPRADPEKPDRLQFKMKFYKLLEMRAHALRRSGCLVLIVGDINTSHKEIDHCDPYEEFEDHPGRRWLDHFLVRGDSDSQGEAECSDEWRIRNETCSQLVQPHSFIDAFRMLHPNRTSAFTCWNTKLNCRSTNYGTRLDYIFISAPDEDSLQSCDILSEVLGSDHCPVSAFLRLKGLPPPKPPKFCTRYFSEFGGIQQKLSAFVIASDKRADKDSDASSGGQPTKRLKTAKQTAISGYFAKPLIKPEPPVVMKVDPDKQAVAASAWKTLMKGPPPEPLCSGHKEKAVLHTVKKKGPNCGRQFWCCGRGEGRADDPNARCAFFAWRR